jgi:hypothetical protein
MSDGRANRQGSAALEAALIIVPLLAFICAVIDASMVMFMKNTMRQAAREGVRYAITGRTEAGMCQDASIKSIVQRSSMGFLDGTHGLDRIDVSYFDPKTFTASDNRPGNIVQVSIRNLPWSWIVPIWHSSAPVRISAASSDVLELAANRVVPCR